MIQSKAEYLYYLQCDKIAMRKETRRPRFKHDVIWTFLRLMRRCEYYENCRKDFVGRLYAKYLKYRYVVLSQRLGFSIGFNTCGPGLCIEHYGCVIINQHAHVGANCRIVGAAVIGATADDKTPIIGDNVFIGFGAAIIGAVTVADGVAIGANAVVSRSVTTPDVTVGGIPASIISPRGSAQYIRKATEVMDTLENSKRNEGID